MEDGPRPRWGGVGLAHGAFNPLFNYVLIKCSHKIQVNASTLCIEITKCNNTSDQMHFEN